MRARTFLVATTVLALAATASAHTAGVPDGFARMAGDCVDDLGGHDPPEGIDLVAIDVREAMEDGEPVFAVRIVYGPAHPVPARIDLAFATPLNNGGDAIMTTIALEKGAPRYLDGVQPIGMEGGLAVTDTIGRVDQERVATELTYAHAQLRAEQGHTVRNFEATAWRNDTTIGDWVRGDYLPGGYYNGEGLMEGMCVAGAEDGFHVAPDGYAIQMDAWSRSMEGSTTDEEPDDPPFADFTYAPVAPAAGADVAFTDRSSDDGVLRVWMWDFGDGQTAAGAAAAHRYERPGAYVVTLTVIDQEEQFAATSRTVHVMAVDSENSPATLLVPMGIVLVGALAWARRRAA